MKRSEINKAIRDMEQMLGEYKFSLPEFCGFAPEKWKSLGHEYDEVRDNALGWDITDVGEDRFTELGFSLITLRNGSWEDRERYPKPYAEKLLQFCQSNGYRISGDYICEVMTEFNVFDEAQRSMYLRLQVPISFEEKP